MRVFVYDLEHGGREWSQLVAPWQFSWWDPKQDTTERGDVIICHRTTLRPGTVTRAQSAASKGVAVMFVSGNPLSGTLEGEIYYRRTPVDKPTDVAFNIAFRRFAKDLEQSRHAHWALIEPLRVPEHLLAYYLFDLAEMVDALRATPSGRALCDAAREECREFQKLSPGDGSSTASDENRDELDRISLRQILAAV